MFSAGFVMLAAGCPLSGCKARPTELRGKTSFGPEFRNRGNNTSEIRYAAQQSFDMKWDNGWTTGVQYRRRDVDEGSGDNENRVLVEVGYPIWKAPKKEDKATDRRIQQLHEEVESMRARVAAMNGSAGVDVSRVAQWDAGR
jgi:hypothetical protein